MQVALAMIVGGHEKNPEMLHRALSSVAKGVDGIFITVTDDNEETVKVAEEFGAEVSYFEWNKNFTEARNFNFNQVPEEYEYIFWMDDDDIYQGDKTPRDLALQAKREKVDAVFLDYWYEVDVDDKGEITEIVTQHPRERIVKNGAFYWESHLHEVLIEKYETKKVLDDSAVLVHLPGPDHHERILERNLEILKSQAEEENYEDPRTIYYLAKTYYDMHTEKSHVLAEGLLKQYLGMSGWDEERAQAREYLHFIYRGQGLVEKAINQLKTAIMEENYKFPSLYINLAACYLMIDDVRAAKHWATVGLHVEDPRTTTIKNTKELKMRTLEVLYNLALHEQNIDDAVEHARKLYQMTGYEHFKELRDTALAIRDSNKAAQSLLYLSNYLEEQDEGDKIAFLLKGSPSDLQNEPFYARLVQRHLPERKWHEKEVCFVANFGGNHFEKWSPKSLERGVGGSEEAVIHLAREWQKMGWEVTVYGDPQDEAGDYNGVHYKPWYQFNHKDAFNVVIAWRSPALFKLSINAKVKLVDMHDIFDASQFEEPEFDRIMVKSQFHRELAPNVADDDVAVISNGIVPVGTSNKNRDPVQMCYTSSYDRGLQHLLEIWPDVKEAVPKASLKICYGWDLFDKSYRDNPERKAWKKKINKLMEQPGIEHLGRISHSEVKDLMRESGIFAYPSHFEEICCISAIKAQLYGCTPVVMDYAALSETVQHGRKIEGDIYTKEGKEAYKEALINELKNPMNKSQRGKMREWAIENYSWEKIAKEWIKYF